jgi:hypothetical protein
VPGFSKKIAVLALAAASGCSEQAASIPPPLDRFYYPTGMAVRTLPNGQSALVVISSNFDLRYDQNYGGTMLSVDPDASPDALACLAACPKGDSACASECGGLVVLGSPPQPDQRPGVVMGSFGGEVALAYGGSTGGAPATCPGLRGATAVTVSRSLLEAYLVGMDDQGGLSCGTGCRVPLEPTLADPYGVVLACRDFGGKQALSAFVTYLRTPGDVGLALGVASPLDLSPDASLTPAQRLGSPMTLDVGAARSGFFDRSSGRLFFTSQYTGSFPLRWLELATSSSTVGHASLAASVPGALPRGLALSTNGERAYLALVIYDALEASRSGTIIAVGAALAVLDVRPGPSGLLAPQLLRLVPLDQGPTEVRAIRRDNKRDLVAVACTDQNSLVLYDDETGSISGGIGVDEDPSSASYGKPKLGKQPFGLAVESLPASRCQSGGPCTRIYVGAFDSSWVSIVEVDPAHPEGLKLVKRIGRERS